MKYSLLYELPTVSDVSSFLKKLAKLKKLSYQVDADPEKILSNTLGLEKTALLTDFCQKKKLSLSKAKLAETMDQVISYLSSLPVLTVTVALPVTDELVEAIRDEYYRLHDQEVILQFKTDPGIVAGAIFEYHGKVVAYTLEGILDKVFR